MYTYSRNKRIVSILLLLLLFLSLSALYITPTAVGDIAHPEKSFAFSGRMNMAFPNLSIRSAYGETTSESPINSLFSGLLQHTFAISHSLGMYFQNAIYQLMILSLISIIIVWKQRQDGEK